jgi:hypothetical protein
MPRPTSLLDSIAIATPCHVPWEDMRGEGRARFCGACKLHVYDIAAMTRAEAEALIRGAEGRLCLQLFRRADGTVLTRDCPRGLREAARRRLRAAAARVAAVVALVAMSLVGGAGCRPQNGILRGSRVREVPGLGRFLDWIDPPPPVCVKGDIALPVARSVSPAPPPPAMLNER